jgi:hypothetical protein
MTIKRHFSLFTPASTLWAGCLLALLAFAVVLWSQGAVEQRPAVPKLTLAQVEQLVSSKVPDSTLSTQIQKRGLAFTPTPAIVGSLRAKGAGPQTLATISTLISREASTQTGRHQVPVMNVAGGVPQGSLLVGDASQPTLEQARREIPGIVTKIYRSLDEGNPQAARAYFSGDVLNDVQQLDAICIPFSYKASYVASVIERPGPVFQARVRTLFKSSDEKAQVFTFQPYLGSFMLLRVEKDEFAAEIESAKEAVRQFIFAVRGGRWDIASRYASHGLPLDQMKSPKWEEYFGKITSAKVSSSETLTKGGILLLIRVDVRDYSSYLPDFLVDPETGLIVRAFFRSPENIFSQLPDPAGFTDPDIEAHGLQRFGLAEASVSPAAKRAPGPIDSEPSLAETMRLIQASMKEQGPVDYVSTTSNRDNPSITTRVKDRSVEDNVVADPAACTLHVYITQNDSLVTSLGGKTFAQGTYDQRVQIASTVSFKDVETITVESRQVSQNRSFVALGHPEISTVVEPSVFVVQLSASKPVFSAHLSTTIGSGAPQVSDNTGAVTEFLFRDEERANRAAKAMRHAVELCGKQKP